MNITRAQAVRYCDDRIELTKKQIHGRRRKDMSLKRDDHARRLEELRQKGKMKMVIRSVMGATAGRKHSDGLNFDVLQTQEGILATCPKEIHRILTEHFRLWHAHTDPVQGIHHANWKSVISNVAEFLQLTAHTGVPDQLRITIFEAMQQVDSANEVSQKLMSRLTDPPSFEEFRHKVKHLSNSSAPGISECTYAMIKQLPLEGLQVMYDSLASMWRAKHIPSWWKWRWLAPIPKTVGQCPSLKDLRPIMLVETSRKIWSALIVNHIQRAWHETLTLDDAQHGFLAKRGTSTAMLMHLNTIEDAQACKEHLHRSSWDMSKAFDSVSKYIMRIAWHRLGVPEDIANWLVSMHEDGVTVIRSEQATEAFYTSAYNGIIHSQQNPPPDMGGRVNNDEQQYLDILAESFDAERGTGQGDIPSPTCWNAVLDILLAALRKDQSERPNQLAVQGGSGFSYPVNEIAYADDIESASRSAEDMQRKADIVSAFCIIMGIQISVTKLRRLVHTWTKTSTPIVPLVIHGYGWTPQEVEVETNASTKYLGNYVDHDNSGKTALTEMQAVAETHSAILKPHPCSAAIKLDIASVLTFNQIKYIAKHANISLAQYKLIDSKLYPLMISGTRVGWGFPKTIIYLPKSKGGLGIRSITDRAMQEKQSMLFASIHRDYQLKEAVEALLLRPFHKDGQIIVP